MNALSSNSLAAPLTTIELMCAIWIYNRLLNGPKEQNGGPQAVLKGERHHMEALVAEIIQNFLDARQTDENGRPIKGRLVFRYASISKSCFENLQMDQVMAHHADCGDIIPHPSTFGASGTVRVLFIEDNGTGLTGSFMPDYDIENLSGAQRFLYSPCVTGGISAKAGNQSGRHGMGSGMLPNSSKWGMFFMSTARNDAEPFAIGMALSRQHYLNGKKYGASGSLLVPVSDDPMDGGMPLTGSMAERLHHDLGFTRPFNAPGTSICIVDPILDASDVRNLLGCVVTRQFASIHRGGGDIEIIDEDIGFERIVSDSSLLSFCNGGYVGDVLSDQTNGRRAAIERRLSCIPQAVRTIDITHGTEPIATATMSISDASPVFTPEAIKAICESVDMNGHAVIKIDVEMRRKSGELARGSALVGVMKAKGLTENFFFHVRDGIPFLPPITASGNRGTDSKRECYMGYVVAEGNEFAEAIGDCEDPSHTRLMVSYGEGKWKDAGRFITCFRDAPRLILSLLRNATRTTIDTTSLRSFFPVLAGPAKADMAGNDTTGENLASGLDAPGVTLLPHDKQPELPLPAPPRPAAPEFVAGKPQHYRRPPWILVERIEGVGVKISSQPGKLKPSYPVQLEAGVHMCALRKGNNPRSQREQSSPSTQAYKDTPDSPWNRADREMAQVFVDPRKSKNAPVPIYGQYPGYVRLERIYGDFEIIIEGYDVTREVEVDVVVYYAGDVE